MSVHASSWRAESCADGWESLAVFFAAGAAAFFEQPQTAETKRTAHKEVQLFRVERFTGAKLRPGVSVGADNTVYFGGVGPDGIPFTAVSRDRGRTWNNFQPIGVELGIQNATFSQMTAGDGDRAAFSFLGTTTPGNYQAPRTTPGGQGFKGTWFLYISTTYDRGLTWMTVNATPNDPVQQGSICNSGTVTCNRQPNDRNLLDFNDIQIDQEGRILAAFADGCITKACIQGLDANNDGFKDNDFAARATIARQSGGRRLLAAFDPVPEEPNAPAAPRVDSVVKESAGLVRVAWSAPDNGGSAITGYNVFRSDTGQAGPYVRLGGATPPTVSADKTTYDDTTATSDIQYFYRVTALNSEGESTNCGEFPVGLPPAVGNVCLIPGLDILPSENPADVDSGSGGTSPAGGPGTNILNVQLAQPFIPNSSDPILLVFTLNTDPNPSGTQPTGTAFFVSMNTPTAGEVRGVRMAFKATPPPGGSPGDPTFESYTVRGNSAGGKDGRFSDPATLKPAEAGSSYDGPSGRITIVVKASNLLAAPGQALTGFNAAVTETTDFGGLGTGATLTLDEVPNGLGRVGSYTVQANSVCAPNIAPVALLTATPTLGPPPLTVTFDASGSSDMDAADSIVSYQFNFGEGTPPPPQSTPMISHTYNDSGTYRATVQVTDSRGKVSENVADVLINVGSLLQNVVSRKMHGTIQPPFDIELPNQGQPGIESRSGGANGTHQMIFTFVDPVTAVGSTDVSGPKGNPSGTGTLGPNANQYTVNLTGVENAQYITVTLNGVQTGGTTLNNVQGTMGLLLGDVNQTGTVDGNDVSAVQAKTRQRAGETNFKADVNTTGTIEGNDVSITQSNTRNRLP